MSTLQLIIPSCSLPASAFLRGLEGPSSAISFLSWKEKDLIIPLCREASKCLYCPSLYIYLITHNLFKMQQNFRSWISITVAIKTTAYSQHTPLLHSLDLSLHLSADHFLLIFFSLSYFSHFHFPWRHISCIFLSNGCVMGVGEMKDIVCSSCLQLKQYLRI